MAVAQIINDQTRQIYKNLIPPTSASLLDEITVASSQASQQTKDLADYECSGTNDEVQIQQAIDDAHNAGGGIVKLSDGTFFVRTQSTEYQSTKCCIFLREHVALVGEGRATTKIKKTDTGNGFALIWCYQQGTGMSVLDLDLDMDNKQNINVCLRAIQISDSNFVNIHFNQANTGFIYMTPKNCTARDLFFDNCTSCLEVNNIDATLQPYVTNIVVNDGLQTLSGFNFRTNTAVKMEGHNWNIRELYMRVCNDKAIHFAECSHCYVRDVQGELLQNAVYFASNAKDCIAERIKLYENYNSPVCVVQGNRNTLREWKVTDAGWDTNIQAVQPDSERTAPFIVSNDGHKIIDLEFNEVEFTYSFDSVRAGIIEASNCEDLALQDLRLDGNLQGNIMSANEIAIGIDVENCQGIQLSNNRITNTYEFGYFMDNVTKTTTIDSYVLGGDVSNTRWGFYTEDEVSRIAIQNISFHKCESSAMKLGGGNNNPGGYNQISGIKCYETGGGGSTGADPAVIKVLQEHNTLSRIDIYNDQHGYFDSKSSGLLINNSHTHLSKCYIDGNVSGSLSIDVNSNDEKALSKGIFIAGPPSNTDFNLNQCYVYNCLRAGILIGQQTSDCAIQGGEIKNTGNNSTPSQAGYNLKVGKSNLTPSDDNGISDLQVQGVTAVKGQYTTRNYKKYGKFGNHITFKENTGLPNDESDYREQLRHGLNAYYSFDGSDFLKDEFGIHHASEAGGGSVVQGSSNGIIKDCAVFNGTPGDIIQPPPGAFDFRDSPFTWSLWFYVDNLTSGKVSLVESGNTSSQNVIGVVFDQDTQQIGMFTIVNNNTPVEVFGSSTLNASTWYHVIMKRDDNDNYALYLNGTLEAEDLDSNATLSRASDLTGSACTINHPTFGQALEGRIDEVACYFRDLAPHHMDQLYGQGNGTQSMLEYKWHDQPAQSDVHMNGHKITNVGAPANAQDATSKRYVDSLAGTPPLKDQIRAYYTFDGDYKDSTTNNYDGQEVGSGSLNFSGTALINQSIEFSGNSGDYVDLGASTFDFSGDFTWQCWVNIKSDQDQPSFLIAGATDDSGSHRIFIGQSDSNDNYQFRLVITGSSYDKYLSGIVPSTGQWYHLILVREGTNYRMYVNGTKQVDITNSETGLTGGVSQIGRDDQFNPDAYIDEVGSWSRALTEQEILHLYNNGNGTQYLSTYDWYAVTQHNHVDMNGYRVSNLGEALQSGDAVDKAYVDSRAPMAQLEQGARTYYKLDGDYTDSIGSFDGTNNGTSFTSGKIGQAIDCSGGNYVDLNGAFTWGSSDFSLQFWFNTPSKNNEYILGNFDNGNYLTVRFDGGGKIKVDTEDNNGLLSLVTDQVFNDNRWYHIVINRSGSTGEIYVDGQLHKTGAIQGGDLSGTPSRSVIGRSHPSNGNDTYPGIIDEVGVWTRALTTNEIKYLYHEGQGTQEFASYDYTFNYDLDMNQHRVLNVNTQETGSFTINDDAHQTLSPNKNQGIVMFQANSESVLAFYDVVNNATQFIQQTGSLFNDAGGNDVATTGLDGSINISSNGGQIIIENRAGSQTTVRALILF